MSTILIVDDDPHILRTLEIMLHSDGHEVWSTSEGETALVLLEEKLVDITLVDLQLPGMSGLELLRKLRDHHRHVDAVIITAYGSIETAVDAMKEGAYDYLTKPFSPEQVRHKLNQIECMRQLKADLSGLRRRLGAEKKEIEFLTSNPALLHVLEIARTVADSDVTVLISGESGTGKNLLAQMIHNWSPRRDKPFGTVDCTTFQETLLESELFGHKRGAFTGAVADKPGKVEAALGGTLFLDEVGELPIQVQGKLLRLVEEHTYERLGDPRLVTMDARIIAATNRDLEDMVKEKAFRQDLFFRLGVVELTIPSLRHRPEDILLLAENFIGQFNQKHNRRVGGMESRIENFLLGYTWPGNVRELIHLLERAVLLCPGRTLRMDHLPPRVLSHHTSNFSDVEIAPLTVVEENYIRKILALGLSQEETARRLGIDQSTLWRKRKKYCL